MIQTKHLVPISKGEKLGGKKITMPGMGISIEELMTKYSAGTLLDKAKGFYEKQGMRQPDWDRLDRIEKLEYLNEYRETVRLNTELLNNKYNEAKQKHARAQADKQKAASQKAQDSGNSGNTGSHQTDDRNRP